MIEKPMLACAIKKLPLRFPLIASPKLDGIRCLKINGKIVTRSLKPIPNHFIRKTLERILPDGADGEIMVGNTFQDCTSGVMRQSGEPDFTFHIFDLVKDLDEPYEVRLYKLGEWMQGFVPFTYSKEDLKRVKYVPTTTILNEEELDAYANGILNAGYEGVMLRDPVGPYKCGRATEKQGWLLKLKPFDDSEAVITGFVEQMHNDNEAKTNELGRTQRSHAKAGMRGAKTLGKFIAKDDKLFPGVELRIGGGEGLTQELRQKIWDNKGCYVNRIIKYKYQKHGTKDAPRSPNYAGFRDARDM